MGVSRTAALLPGLEPDPPRPPKRKKPAAPQESKAGQHFEIAACVAVASQVDELTYGVPEALLAGAVAGARVTVPLRGRAETGVVLQVLPAADAGPWRDKLRPVLAVNPGPPLPADLLETVRFAAHYYHATLGQCARLALPAALRRTGMDGDARAERVQPWVAATYVRPWPADLTKALTRLLHKIEAEGSLPVAELRQKGAKPAAGDPKINAAGTNLQELADRGLVRVWQERVLRDPLGLRESVARDTPPQLNAEQRAVVDDVVAGLRAGAFAGHLLHGVTGSGKTEVYLHAIGAALAMGKGAVVLVPEIALTPQLVQRFRARFGDQVAALHSAMPEGQRLDQLDLVAAGSRRIVIGPRSALFAPMVNLGVIVVDECHDASYKQQSGVRYHARDLALVRARHAGAACILGSATPNCEEWHLQQTGRLRLHRLAERATQATLPAVQLVDLNQQARLRDIDGKGLSMLGETLVEQVALTVERGEQAILLHNRRGFASAMLCPSCGSPVECTDCAVALTWHRHIGRLRCHWCDLSLPDRIACPRCKAPNLIGVGAGTERIEASLAVALADRLPNLRIARFDRDTASGRRLIDTLNRFRDGHIDVLVGTQMLAKGHDFPRVTLVGVILAEEGLHVADFRACERTFQLLTQVAGRAGRGDLPGRVVVQTFQPLHFAIGHALQHDSEGFLRDEMAGRQRAHMPPFAHLALVEAAHTDAELARKTIEAVAEFLRAHGGDVRGPVQAAVARVREVWRFHALIKAAERKPLHAQLTKLRRELLPQLPSAVQVTIDVDPAGFA